MYLTVKMDDQHIHRELVLVSCQQFLVRNKLLQLFAYSKYANELTPKEASATVTLTDKSIRQCQEKISHSFRGNMKDLRDVGK
jgi:hypothetical protein